MRAGATNESIGQEALAVLALQLLNLFLIRVTLLSKSQENVLSDFSLGLSRCSTEELRVTIKPLVNLLVDVVVLIANLLGRHAFLDGLDLGGSAVLVGTTHKHRVIPAQATEPGVDISRQDTSDDVAQMGYVVNVRQSRSDKNISAAFLRQELLTLVGPRETSARGRYLHVFPGSFLLGKHSLCLDERVEGSKAEGVR